MILIHLLLILLGSLKYQVEIYVTERNTRVNPPCYYILLSLLHINHYCILIYPEEVRHAHMMAYGLYRKKRMPIVRLIQWCNQPHVVFSFQDAQ